MYIVHNCVSPAFFSCIILSLVKFKFQSIHVHVHVHTIICLLSFTILLFEKSLS